MNTFFVSYLGLAQNDDNSFFFFLFLNQMSDSCTWLSASHGNPFSFTLTFSKRRPRFFGFFCLFWKYTIGVDLIDKSNVLIIFPFFVIFFVGCWLAEKCHSRSLFVFLGIIFSSFPKNSCLVFFVFLVRVKSVFCCCCCVYACVWSGFVRDN